MFNASLSMNNKDVIGIVVIALLFFLGAVIAQEFSGEIATYLDYGFASMVVYIGAGIFATVVAPISTVPLIPIAAALWGPLVTGLLSVVAWSIGSIIAFLVARRFGKPMNARFVNIEKIAYYEHALGSKHLFWDLVFLRAAVPVDIFSYAVGLFTSVNLGTYTIATVIGITPFALILSYAPQVSMVLQVCIGLLILVTVYVGYRKMRRQQKQESSFPD